MTTFDKREQGFEAKFIHDEELRFKATARSNKLLGDWAAVQLGLTGDAAASCANELVTADMASQTSDATLRKVANDLASKGISEQQVARRMDECFHIALGQIEAGNWRAARVQRDTRRLERFDVWTRSACCLKYSSFVTSRTISRVSLHDDFWIAIEK